VGSGNQSIAPSAATRATVRPSPMAAYEPIGAYPSTRSGGVSGMVYVLVGE